jgi:hypothetical protein
MGSGDTFTDSSVNTEADSDRDDRGAKELANTAKDQGAALAQSAVDTGTQLAHEATTQISAVATEAKNQLGEVVGQVKDEFRTQLDARGRQVADGLRTLSSQLSSLAQGRPEEAGRIGDLLGDAQLRIQSYADSLQQRGPQAIVEDLSAFARRRPGVFLLGAGVSGFAIGRLVRGSATAKKGRDVTGPRELAVDRGVAS